MKIIKRTGEEIKAYVEGYNACYKDFEKQLGINNQLHRALGSVDTIRIAINACIDKGGKQ